jgi:hypothetical protein
MTLTLPFDSTLAPASGSLRLIASLLLVLCLTEAMAQAPPQQSQPQHLTYEEVLARWDRSRTYGDPRDLKTFAADMNQVHPETDFSAAFRDGPWIRLYARGEQIFSGATGLVTIGVLIAILFAILFLPSRFLNALTRKAVTPAKSLDTPPSISQPGNQDHEACVFYCAHCGARIPWRTSWAGRRTICPSCESEVIAPSFEHPSISSTPTVPQRSIWQQALPPAFKAASFGGLIAAMSIFGSRAEATFGQRILLYIVFAALLAALFFAVVYLIAVMIYAAKR